MGSMTERRAARRRPIDVFFNKFLDGYPYLCRTIDISEKGALVETYAEPDREVARVPLELRFPGDGDSLWLWARTARHVGRYQAFEFVSVPNGARRHLRRLVNA